MTNLNKVILIGRLTKDAELTSIPEKGDSICKFSIAVNRDYYSKTENQKKTDVTYINSAIFGSFAESMVKYLKKGTLINIVGHLKTHSWTKENKAYSKLDVITDSLELLSTPRNDSVPGETENNEQEYKDEIEKANEAVPIIPNNNADYEYNDSQAAVYGDIF